MTAARQTAPLPDWPALLDVHMAAAYVGLGEQSFRVLAAHHKVKPADMTPIRATRYRRADLDQLVDRLGRGRPDAPPEAGPTIDPAEERRRDAIKRADRRARR